MPCLPWADRSAKCGQVRSIDELTYLMFLAEDNRFIYKYGWIHAGGQHSPGEYNPGNIQRPNIVVRYSQQTISQSTDVKADD